MTLTMSYMNQQEIIESKRMIATKGYLILNYVTIWHEDDHVVDLFGS